jgi:hypothetical protein
MSKRMVVGILAAAAVASHCSEANPPCPPYVGIGLVVTVVNDRTEEPICDAVVAAQQANATSSIPLTASSQCAYNGAYGSGSYSVHAERSGFRPGDLSGVLVPSTGGDCPVAERTDVTLRLIPLM